VICSPKHRELALKAAHKSIVLLSNKDGLLPLDKTRLTKIAVIGPHADLFTPGGYSGKADNPVRPLQGIKNRAAQGTEVLYAKGCEITGMGGAKVTVDRESGFSKGASVKAEDLRYTAGTPEQAGLIAEAAAIARSADVAIVYVGTTNAIEAEGRDRTSLGLPGRQEELVMAVLAANPKTVVVLMNAGPLTIPWIKDSAPAVLEAWWNGVEGGNALADVLFGDVNPGGRLPHTVYASEGQVPPQDEYDVTKGFSYMYLNGKPLFAFGHGLSYTQFRYSGLQVLPKQIPTDGKVSVSVEVENTGVREGDEVVQLYVHDVQCSVKRPSKELRGFERVRLRPGEKRTVTFTLPGEKLAFYEVKTHGFVVEPGTFDVWVGSSSDDIRARGQLEVVESQQ